MEKDASGSFINPSEPISILRQGAGGILLHTASASVFARGSQAQLLGFPLPPLIGIRF